jgi:hypothetical protein
VKRPAQIRTLAAVLALTRIVAQAHAESSPDGARSTEFRLHQRVIGTFDAQSAISRRVFDWQRTLPNRRFKLDMNSYAPGRRIYVDDRNWIDLRSDGTIILSQPGVLGNSQRAAKFNAGDPVLVELRSIFAEAEKQAEQR